jgi:hypothetical protein
MESHKGMCGEEPNPQHLALRPRQAAKVLGISERKLWSLKAAGEIPFIQTWPGDALPGRGPEAVAR